MKNLMKHKGSVMVLALVLGFVTWCVASPHNASGQVKRGDPATSERLTPAPSIQEILAESGTPLTCSTPFTFETGAQGFTVQPVAGPALWHVTSNICGAQLAGHSPISTFYYGRDSDCTYVEGVRSSSFLISPTILIPTDIPPVVVSFNYLLRVEGGFFDQVAVDVSTDNGANWSLLIDKPSLFNDGAWHNAAVTVPPAVVGTANTIKLRFRFDTQDSLFNTTVGWHVDDIQVCSQPFDFCVQDDVNGTILQFNSTTGDYQFRDCRKGVRLAGKGVTATSFCKVELFDGGPNPKAPDRRVSVTVNPCTKKGNGSVSIFSTGQSYSINDSNITDNICGCP